jgi:hypothetical protein
VEKKKAEHDNKRKRHSTASTRKLHFAQFNWRLLWIVKVELINYWKFAETPSCIFCTVYRSAAFIWLTGLKFTGTCSCRLHLTNLTEICSQEGIPANFPVIISNHRWGLWKTQDCAIKKACSNISRMETIRTKIHVKVSILTKWLCGKPFYSDWCYCNHFLRFSCTYLYK